MCSGSATQDYRYPQVVKISGPTMGEVVIGPEYATRQKYLLICSRTGERGLGLSNTMSSAIAVSLVA